MRKAPKAFAIILGAAVFVACQAFEWPMFRGNGMRTGAVSFSVSLPDAAPLWVDTLEGPIVSSPAMCGGMLYIGCRDSALYAIEAATGRKVWNVKTGGWVDASPLIHNGRLFVGSRDGYIHLIDTSKQAESGRLNAGLQLSSPAVISSEKIFTGLGPPLSGFSLYNPTLAAWAQGKPEWSIVYPAISYSSPAVTDSTAVIGTNDGRLFAVDAGQKDTLWSIQTNGGCYLSTPAIKDSVVFFAPGNYDTSVYAVDLRSGSIKWKSGTNALAKISVSTHFNRISPVLFSRLLHMSPGYRAAVIAKLRQAGVVVPNLFDARGLAKTSRTSADDFLPMGDIKTSSVAVDKNQVYVIQKQLGYPLPRFTMLALNKNSGTEAWRFTEYRNDEKIGYCSSPIVTGNAVFFGWGEGRVFALDPKTGKSLWSDSLKGNVISSPALDSQRIYFATMDGLLYAYRLGDATGVLPSGNALNFAQFTRCFPNPGRGRYLQIATYVSQNAKLNVTVYSLAGKRVLKVNESLKADRTFIYNWDIRTAANGMYLVNVSVQYQSGIMENKSMKVAITR
jgi:outer membrane protein assembly factor BamB